MTTRRSLELSLTSSLVFLAGAPAVAAAQAPVQAPAVDPVPIPEPPVTAPAPPEPARALVPRPPPAGDARLALGYRQAIIADRGFDAFAADDRLSQLSLETSYAALNGRTGALAAGIAWDFGSRGATTEGFQASLTVHRLTVPIEGRLYLSSWAYAFGRVAPGAAVYQARVTAPATPLSGAPWVVAVDSSAGVSFLLGPHGERSGRIARVWLTPEVGYGWSDSSAIQLTGERGPAILAGVSDRLPEVAIRGPFFRAQIGFTL
jgi:hypothetical protein